MAVASLILGILSIFISVIPVFGIISIVPAIMSFVFGLVAIFKKTEKNKSKAMQIAGVVLSSISIAIAIFWIFCIIFVSEIAAYFDDYDIDWDAQMERYIPVYDLNEDADLGNVIVKLESVSLDYNNENVVKPQTGYKYVAYKVHIKNISNYNFNLYEPLITMLCDDGNVYGSDYNKVYSNTNLISVTIKPGEITTGIIAFEIPINTEEEEIIFPINENTYKFEVN